MLHAIATLVPATTQSAHTRPELSGFAEMMRSLQIGTTFQRTTWREWGWLLLMIFIGVAVGKLLQLLLKAGSERMRKRGWDLRATFVESHDGPLQVFALTVGLSAGLLPIYHASAQPVQSVIIASLRLLTVIFVGWFFYNLIDVISLALGRMVRGHSALASEVVPLARKSMRVFLVVVLVLFGAQFVFGADITAWLAGLGIAGLAVSLAAQDSLKNLFGSITVLLDRPFQIGDRVIIDGHDGNIEEIGFRSTKLRKGSGELVSIPNSKVVDASVVNVQRRPNLQRVVNLGLTYDTPPAKVVQAVQIVRDILAEPQVAAPFDMEKNPPRVYFDAFNADSLNIKVQYWYTPASDAWGFQDHGQTFNEKLLEKFAAAEIELAFPTRAVFLAQDPKRPSDVSVPSPRKQKSARK
jgi:MscS family membrane protein